MTKLSIVGAVALAVASVSVADAKPSNVVVFGDSLVDSGNVFLATGGATPAAAQGYFQGRFQDGYNFADLLNLELTGAPTVASLAGGNNWAWGGSRGTGVGGFAVPGLNAQAGDFLLNGPRGFTASSLVILNFGGNDVFGLQSGDTGGLSSADFADLYVSNMVGAITALDALGAGRILVMGVPNPTAAGLMLDSMLQTALNGIEPGLDATLYRFSYADFYSRILSDPTSYGFPPIIDTQTPCIAARPVVNGQIDCTGFFSFDGTHFTGQVHRALASDLRQVLGIPEPATWGLMILGFGAVGIALRRRQPLAA
jgi:phospholipase/lecithinase/hemolysin